jgi:hypothetical protein
MYTYMHNYNKHVHAHHVISAVTHRGDVECPNGVLGKILHTLKGNLDIAICSGAIVGPILMTLQLYGERGREREKLIRWKSIQCTEHTLSSSLRLVTMTMVGQSNSHTILQKSGKVEGCGP